MIQRRRLYAYQVPHIHPSRRQQQEDGRNSPESHARIQSQPTNSKKGGSASSKARAACNSTVRGLCGYKWIFPYNRDVDIDCG